MEGQGTGGVVEERKCIVGDIVYGPRRAGARCSDAHNGRDVHLPQEPIIRYGGRSLYVPPLSLARIAYGPLANSFLSNPISPPFLPVPPFVRLLLIDKLAGPGQNDQRRDDRSWNTLGTLERKKDEF